MKIDFDAGVLPGGFTAAGVSCGIKRSGKKDLAVFVSRTPCAAAAMMTTNRIKAAPLLVSAEHLRKAAPQALIVNSGNANCMTGAQGLRDARQTAKLAAAALGLSAPQVLVGSTGIIGKFLPMAKIRVGISSAARQLRAEGMTDAARAIMTTDTFPKEACVRLPIGGRTVTISGIAKGAGMIAPRMKQATMLSYIFTDAAINQKGLRRVLTEAVDVSFNAITIDGCMSTNDTVIVLANGAAGNAVISWGSEAYRAFGLALKSLCLELAKLIVKDAEGATKLIEIEVQGARARQQAQTLAFAVANSLLFKCAMFGSDPNWGRIAAALGSVEVDFDWRKLDIVLNGCPVFRRGRPSGVSDAGLLKGRDIKVEIHLHQGVARQTVYTSDLSYDYVKINADYN
jgi:glutamate N-acetyltransferase/amino-acid N-acetyltransferase